MTVDDASGPTEGSVGTGGSVRTRAEWPVFIGLAVTVLILDQISKAILVANLSPGEVVSVIGDYVRFVFSQNSGALFGLFHDQAILFGLVSIGVVALIIWYHGHAGRSLYLSITLGLLLGGALGNMTDRLRLGYVVDFVDIGIGGFRWYTFNVADVAVSAALVMLFGLALVPGVARMVDERSGG